MKKSQVLLGVTNEEVLNYVIHEIGEGGVLPVQMHVDGEYDDGEYEEEEDMTCYDWDEIVSVFSKKEWTVFEGFIDRHEAGEDIYDEALDLEKKMIASWKKVAKKKKK